MHGASSEISGVYSVVQHTWLMQVLMKIQVFRVVTPCRLVNTDIFEDLAASPSGSIPEDFDFCVLFDLPMVSALVIYIIELNCNLRGGFKICCGASKGVSYMLSSLHTINLQGQYRNGNMCCCRTVNVFCLPLQVI